MRSGTAHERGATAVLVAMALAMLLGFAALAVDASMGYNERRGTTNAADNAALAAAWEECNPTGIGPEAAALETASANGYENDGNTVVDPLPLDEGEWQVTISETDRGFFGPATPHAGDSLTVVSEAVALCDPTEFLEGNAIFAGGDSCPIKELDMTGSSITVDGAIHSNGDLKIHATPETEILSGPITYGDTGTHGDLDPESPRDYPLEVDISEYRPGGGRATGLYFDHDGVIDNAWLEAEEHIDPATGLLQHSGIYYTSYSHNAKAAIELKDLSVKPGETVTFVAEGFIRLIGGTFDNFRSHDPIVPGGSVGMLFFSDFPGPPPGDCNDNAIQLSANTSLTNAAGVIYAPNAGVQVSNSSMDLDGSIIAFTVNTSGATISVTYQDDPAFIPKYQVELLR